MTLSFFHYFGHFGRKTTKSHEKNFTREKIFDFEIFGLKYVLKHSESIPTKKNFRPKFFDLVIFSLFWPFWPKNDRVRAKKNYTGKIFYLEIFVLRYVSNHSESIQTKKFFSTKIFYLCHFFAILVILAEKRLSPTKKNLHGKKFWISRFSF